MKCAGLPVKRSRSAACASRIASFPWKVALCQRRVPRQPQLIRIRKQNMSIVSRLAELGVTLPDAPAPAANYVPFVKVGNVVHVSGQVSSGPDGLIVGKLGADMSVEDGAAAARSCAISLLAQVKAACGGDIDRLVRVVKLTGFVNSTGDFGDQPKVINGASDFLVEALGDAGRHARSAVSAASLPFGVAVEIEGIFEIR
jgi:enamine deaminase RidA (YjgF/YER057c/UK114 family)